MVKQKLERKKKSIRQMSEQRFNKQKKAMEDIVHIPVKKSPQFAFQPIMYKIYGSDQGNGYLKGWTFFGWKEKSKSSQY